jgi:hypothetical protein
MAAPWPVIEARVREVLAEGAAAPGHVFNLGHGVRPEMDPDLLRRVVDLVHAVTAGREGGDAPGSGITPTPARSAATAPSRPPAA